MNQSVLPPLPASTSPKSSTNPFARALAETEQNTYNQPQQNQDRSPFTDALSQTGGQFGDLPNGMSADFMERQQEEMLKQQRREALRKKLHDQVNPVDNQAIFDAREKEVKKQIDQLRADLQMLSKDVAKFDKEIEMTLLTEVVEPGQTGTYFINFFQKLRSLIMLLRQKIKSASTWAQTTRSKNKKKSKKPGLVIGGQDHEKTSTVQDMMHHERSSSYGGA